MRLYSSFATHLPQRWIWGCLLDGIPKPDHNQPTNRHWIVPAISQPPKKTAVYIIDILQTFHASFVGFYSWYGRHPACKKAWISLTGVKLPLTQPMDQGNQKFGNLILPYEKNRHSQKLVVKVACLAKWVINIHDSKQMVTYKFTVFTSFVAATRMRPYQLSLTRFTELSNTSNVRCNCAFRFVGGWLGLFAGVQ